MGQNKGATQGVTPLLRWHFRDSEGPANQFPKFAALTRLLFSTATRQMTIIAPELVTATQHVHNLMISIDILTNCSRSPKLLSR